MSSVKLPTRVSQRRSCSPVLKCRIGHPVILLQRVQSLPDENHLMGGLVNQPQIPTLNWTLSTSMKPVVSSASSRSAGLPIAGVQPITSASTSASMSLPRQPPDNGVAVEREQSRQSQRLAMAHDTLLRLYE